MNESFKDHIEKQEMLKIVSNAKINPKLRTHCNHCKKYIEKCDGCGAWLQHDACSCSAVICCVEGKHYCDDCYDDPEAYALIIPKSELKNKPEIAPDRKKSEPKFKMGFRMWGTKNE